MSSDSELSDSDVELQEALLEGRLKPGLNKVEKVPKKFINNVSGLKQKVEELKLNLPWIERLDCTSSQAPLAPEFAAQMLIHEEKRSNQLKNNKKLPQFSPSEDPVLNDFKREIMFQRQAQATILEAIPKLKAMGISTKRPDDYFAEMAKTDAHMHKIREQLQKKQEQQKRIERVKQLRQQRKDGKMLQIQTKLQRSQEKKEMLAQVKKVRKGVSKNLDFLDGKNKPSKKIIEKRKMKDKKFGFGGKKRGMKKNTRESAGDISEYKSPGKPGKKFNQNQPGQKFNQNQARQKFTNKNKGKSNRMGKNRRMKMKTKSKK
ncbi:unnamed protein product [Psylliodes chrysocephalus]|uniref:Uncharacterized protein n=1 Tax=Psylliodes chrysocephalus TaxID=3402493 RepID=A0A9P0GAY1_9CUCU|nr:unnamed protein product [Psylliodes chrysocephala]